MSFLQAWVSGQPGYFVPSVDHPTIQLPSSTLSCCRLQRTNQELLLPLQHRINVIPEKCIWRLLSSWQVCHLWMQRARVSCILLSYHTFQTHTVNMCCTRMVSGRRTCCECKHALGSGPVMIMKVFIHCFHPACFQVRGHDWVKVQSLAPVRSVHLVG